MAPPAKLPEWNTNATNRVEPSAGTKASGFATNDVPSSGTENWWRSLVNEWITHLQTALVHVAGNVTGAYSWMSAQMFRQEVTLGANGNNTFVNGPLLTAATVTMSSALNANGPLVSNAAATFNAAVVANNSVTFNADTSFMAAAIGADGFSVPATKGYKYGTPGATTPRTFYKHVSAIEFDSLGTSRPAGGSEATQFYQTGQAGSAIEFGVRLHLPTGAVITNVKLLAYNVDGVARTIQWAVRRVQYNSGGAYSDGGSVGFANTSVPTAGTATYAWYELGSITNATAPNDGMFLARVTVLSLTTAGSCGFAGMRVSYTLAELVPS